MERHTISQPHYIHHQKSKIANVLSEVIFGVEDGMVSTLGSVTGIAIGSANHQTVILAGVVIIAVESISMGIGSYLSNRSEEEVDQRKIHEEKEELAQFPAEEKEELREMLVKDGWSPATATHMAEEAAQNPQLMLKEMMLRELHIVGDGESVSVKGGLSMFFSYIIGGCVPLSVYLFLPIPAAMFTSIILTLVGLFVLGMATTRFTHQPLLKSGMRVLVMGGLALTAGLIAGIVFRQ